MAQLRASARARDSHRLGEYGKSLCSVWLGSFSDVLPNRKLNKQRELRMLAVFLCSQHPLQAGSQEAQPGAGLETSGDPDTWGLLGSSYSTLQATRGVCCSQLAALILQAFTGEAGLRVMRSGSLDC